MQSQVRLPDRYPVRGVAPGGWQVLVVPEGRWVRCQSEGDARAIARSPVLEHEALLGLGSGEDLALRLDDTSQVLARHGLGRASRFLARLAKGVRERDG